MIHHSVHSTSDYEPRKLADMTNPNRILISNPSIIDTDSEQYNQTHTYTDHAMTTSPGIQNMQVYAMDYKSWSLEIEIHLEQKQVLGIVNGTHETLEAKDRTEFKALKKQHQTAQLTILLAMEPSSLQQYHVQNDLTALCDLLREDHKLNWKLNVLALQDKMSAV